MIYLPDSDGFLIDLITPYTIIPAKKQRQIPGMKTWSGGNIDFFFAAGYTNSLSEDSAGGR
jgi:hypothetical protein